MSTSTYNICQQGEKQGNVPLSKRKGNDEEILFSTVLILATTFPGKERFSFFLLNFLQKIAKYCQKTQNHGFVRTRKKSRHGFKISWENILNK